MKIEQAIQQDEFKSEYQKVTINILYTASWLSGLQTEVLKPFKISWQQFNILRILRGMHPKTVTVKLLAERMIDKMSNASRLVEKLKQKGFVERKSCPKDRRRVDINITDKGLEVLEKASNILESSLNEQLSKLSTEEANQLNELMDKMRG